MDELDCRTMRCRQPLVTEDEKHFGYCEDCLDAAWARYQERREWNEAHTDTGAAP